jgi:hypothetical protein
MPELNPIPKSFARPHEKAAGLRQRPPTPDKFFRAEMLRRAGNSYNETIVWRREVGRWSLDAEQSLLLQVAHVSLISHGRLG